MKKIEKKQSIVVPILVDAILFSRISVQMTALLNAFNPKEITCDFDPESYYSGSCSATAILKIKDEKLDNILYDLYYNLVYGNSTEGIEASTLEARELANIIFVKWVKAIKKYNSSYKLIA